MPFSDPAVTSINARITLPAGMSGKVRMFNMSEDKRWKDSEGLDDGGYQTGKVTGHAISGQVAGFLNASNPGFGQDLENVAVTFTADTGRTMTGNFTFTNISWGVSVGELQSFSASFRSNGPYTITL